MKFTLYIFFISFCFCFSGHSQIKIGDNPQNIDTSSVLELESTSHVLVITRVTTLQMEAITPRPGGMVFNTDTQCVHYYSGASWINLCEAGGISNLSTDPINNDFSTITITPQGDVNHIEVGLIRGDQIADNSIGNSKLGENSVTSDELSDNSVGTLELQDNSLTPIDFADDNPNQVLGTDINGVVNWIDAASLTNVNTDSTTIIGNGSLANPLQISATVLAEIEANTTANTNDTDGDENNETLTNAEIVGNNLILTESGNTTTIDLSAFSGTGTDSQTLAIIGDSLAITGGNSVNIAPFLDNTDAQELSIDGNRISLVNGGFVDLPAGTVDTDQQAILGGQIVGDSLRIDIENGTSGSIDISSLTTGGGSGTTEVVDEITLTGVGTTANPFRIKPALDSITENQMLITDSTSGEITWVNVPNGGTGTPVTDEDVNDGLTNFNTLTGYNINVDNSTIGIVSDTLQVVDNAITTTKILDSTITLADFNSMGATTNGQIIKWDATNTAWVIGEDETGSAVFDEDVNDGLTNFNSLTGYNINVDSSTIGIVSDTLQVVDNAITTTKILDSTITLADFSTMGATTNGQIIKWDATNTAWVIGEDENTPGITAINTGFILTGNASNEPVQITINGDATMDVNGFLTIANDSIKTENILDGTITLQDLSTMGATANGQIIKWDATNTTWVIGEDETGVPPVVDSDANDGLSTYNTTTGYNVNVDNTTIEITADTLQVKDKGIATIKIQEGTDGQVLTTNGTTVEWANPAVIAMGKVDALAAAVRSNGVSGVVKNSAGNYTVTLASAASTADYIIQLTLLGGTLGSTIQVVNQTTTNFTVQISEPEEVTLDITYDNSTTFEEKSTEINPVDGQWYFTILDF